MYKIIQIALAAFIGLYLLFLILFAATAPFLFSNPPVPATSGILQTSYSVKAGGITLQQKYLSDTVTGGSRPSFEIGVRGLRAMMEQDGQPVLLAANKEFIPGSYAPDKTLFLPVSHARFHQLRIVLFLGILTYAAAMLYLFVLLFQFIRESRAGSFFTNRNRKRMVIVGTIVLSVSVVSWLFSYFNSAWTTLATGLHGFESEHNGLFGWQPLAIIAGLFLLVFAQAIGKGTEMESELAQTI